jgi:D-lyxose ketol-isomerase
MAAPSIKRSEVNRIMREADQFIRSFGYILPPFAYWSPKEFQERKGEAQAIINANLGWDITDYGLGEFEKTGLFLFTVRNGDANDLRREGDDLAERAVLPDAPA